MKRTTVMLEDDIFRQIKTRAAKSGRSLKDSVNDLIRMGLNAGKAFDPAKLPPLPTSRMGMKNLDLTSREDMYPEEDDDVRMGRRRNDR